MSLEVGASRGRGIEGSEGSGASNARPLDASALWLDPVPRPGYQNMAIDQALFELAEQTGQTFWRLYRWEPFCLSFGRHEPASRRYDRALIAGLGIDCVRRPTGGRAVWHARELTYAVAAPIASLGGLRAAYRTIHALLARAVSALGAPAATAGDRTTPGLGSGPCFDAAVGGEVLVGGKKVIGSAQRRGEIALLQHGSMLLGDDQGRVRAVQLRAPPEIVDAPEAALSALLGREVSFSEAAAAVAAVLAEAGIGPAVPDPPNEVLGRAARHYDSYRSDTRTWER